MAFEADQKHSEDVQAEDLPPVKVFWPMVAMFTILHALTLLGLKAVLQGNFQWATIIFTFAGIEAGILGTTVGAHRLWSHRSFKANLPLRFFLLVLQTISLQGSVWYWVAWHRAHHKHCDKELDPHNASRGFFYAHIGWLLTYDPKRFRAQYESIRLDDVEADPLVMWQDRYYSVLTLMVNIVLMSAIPWYFWNEDLVVSVCIAASARITIGMNMIFLINSAAHMYGYRPYDVNIFPHENKLVSWLTIGEGWHNYHHTFPWDYRASEFGGFYRFNPSAAFIDFFAYIGWAYDLKTASPELVAKRIERTGERQLQRNDDKQMEGTDDGKPMERTGNAQMEMTEDKQLAFLLNSY